MTELPAPDLSLRLCAVEACIVVYGHCQREYVEKLFNRAESAAKRDIQAYRALNPDALVFSRCHMTWKPTETFRPVPGLCRVDHQGVLQMLCDLTRTTHLLVDMAKTQASQLTK